MGLVSLFYLIFFCFFSFPAPEKSITRGKSKINLHYVNLFNFAGMCKLRSKPIRFHCFIAYSIEVNLWVSSGRCHSSATLVNVCIIYLYNVQNSFFKTFAEDFNSGLVFGLLRLSLRKSEKMVLFFSRETKVDVNIFSWLNVLQARINTNFLIFSHFNIQVLYHRGVPSIWELFWTLLTARTRHYSIR